MARCVRPAVAMEAVAQISTLRRRAIRAELRSRSGLLPIAAIALLAGILRLIDLGGGSTESFYAAAVRSMGLSWHNFLFAAFDPSAGVAVDKPPLDLWLQVASTKLLGFSEQALMLPHALAATLAVPLLYDLVRRGFGRGAGLAAALALALLPVSVLIARSDTMDSLMMALEVLGAWLVVRAAETARLRPLLLAAVVLGLGFEVKLFEALIPLPAIALLYVLATRGIARPRPRALAAAVAVFLVTALAWPTLVSLVPSHQRPYALGSRDGSVWNAIFVFNGTQRLSPPSYRHPHTRRSAAVAAARPARASHPRARRHHRRLQPSRSAALLGGSGESAGPLRLFELGSQRYGQDVGIELAGAFGLGTVALFAAWRARRRRSRAGGAETAAPLRVAMVASFGLWLLTGYVLFSRVHAGLHDRYLEAMTPAVAAVLGIGAVESARAAARSRAVLVLLAAAVALLCTYAVRAAGGDTALAAVCAAAGTVAVGSAVAAHAGRRRLERRVPFLIGAAATLALVPALAVAASRSLEVVRQTSLERGSGVHVSRSDARLSEYLLRNDRGAYYEAATYSFAPAAPLVLRDARPVLVLTSYTDQVVPAGTLARYAQAGRVRYAVIGGRCGTAPPAALGGCPESIRWLRSHSHDVTRAAGLHGHGLLFRIAPASKQ